MNKIFFLGLPLLLTGCASLLSTPFPTVRPDDFQLEYYWETGSLPPPYFYSYRIPLGPGTRAEIEFQADYSGDNTPVWLEVIDITENDLDQLYEMLYTMGMFEKEGRQVTDTPTGGSASSLTGMAYGNRFDIPSFDLAGLSESIPEGTAISVDLSDLGLETGYLVLKGKLK